MAQETNPLFRMALLGPNGARLGWVGRDAASYAICVSKASDAVIFDERADEPGFYRDSKAAVFPYLTTNKSYDRACFDTKESAFQPWDTIENNYLATWGVHLSYRPGTKPQDLTTGSLQPAAAAALEPGWQDHKIKLELCLPNGDRIGWVGRDAASWAVCVRDPDEAIAFRVFEKNGKKYYYDHTRGHEGWAWQVLTVSRGRLSYWDWNAGVEWNRNPADESLSSPGYGVLCTDRKQRTLSLPGNDAHADWVPLRVTEEPYSDADVVVSVRKEFLYPDSPNDGWLDTFDHVVVLMMENRSIDNLLGYMYPDGVPASAPLGKTFEGIYAAEQRNGGDLSNPVPADYSQQPPSGHVVNVSPVTTSDMSQCYVPFPDPGEEYDHVNRQLFNLPDDNPGTGTPGMQGFVGDYIGNYFSPDNYKEGQLPPADYDIYRQIMQCYTPSQVPVITKLAEEFGVFDHWFCAVPSQTWCNRAFWNAGTSWGRVNNGPSKAWLWDSFGDTVFNQIEDSRSSSKALDWNVYTDNPFVALTSLIHAGALLPYHPLGDDNHFFGLGEFQAACASGNLPAYSFVEPKFMTMLHNDYHPSSVRAGIADVDPKGPTVLLGEQLVANVYEAIRKSPKRDRILFILTFDEHGGTYDHVAPGGVTPPDIPRDDREDGFDFKRLGIRVPTIMVSSHIAKNTVVNTPMHHGSFLRTVGKKWNKIVPGAFLPLTPRVADAPEFTEVFTSAEPRDWKEIPMAKSTARALSVARDHQEIPLTRFERQIVEAAARHPLVLAHPEGRRRVAARDAATLRTVREAMDYLESLPKMKEG